MTLTRATKIAVFTLKKGKNGYWIVNKFLNKQAFKLRSERVITQIRLGFKIPFNKNVAF